jgi:ribosomal protein L6P/L9E
VRSRAEGRAVLRRDRRHRSRGGRRDCRGAARGPRRRAPLGHVADHGREPVRGRHQGLRAKLEINGVGYRAAVRARPAAHLGYSHDVDFPIPSGITITTPKPTEIVVTGIEPAEGRQVAAEIREFRKPEPYKGKGIKYARKIISARKARRSKGHGQEQHRARLVRVRAPVKARAGRRA